MLKQYKQVVLRLLVVVDAAVTLASFLAAYWIRNDYLARGDRGPLYPLEHYGWVVLVVLPVWILLLWLFDVYRSYRTATFFREFLAIVKAVSIGGLALGTVLFASQSYYLSRSFILIFVVINILSLGLVRFAVRAFSWYVRKRGYNFRRVLIVINDESALQIAGLIESHRKWGLRMIGFVTETCHDRRSSLGGYRVLGCLDDMEQIIRREVVDEVIFPVMGQRIDQYENIFLMLEDHGINARMVVNIFPHLIARVQLDELDKLPLLTFSTLPSNVIALGMKRLLDVVGAMALLVLNVPIMAAAAIAGKVTSPGPVLFRQKRCGLNGRTFTLYKFRSMYADAEDRKHELNGRNKMSGPVFKVSNDPRVTPVGRFLRSKSIDELPQLWNVLKGDMSIVGPRPPLPEEVERYDRWQRRRLSMRPGLTCLWQVNGRNAITDFNEWVKLDLQYIDAWSLGLDVKIFLKTIPVVLFSKGAL